MSTSPVVHANKNQLVGHAGQPCQSPLDGLMSTFNGMNVGNLSAPAACGPGRTAVQSPCAKVGGNVGAPQHPWDTGRSGPTAKPAHPGAGPSPGAAAPRSGPAPSQPAPSSSGAPADHMSMPNFGDVLKVAQTIQSKGLSQQDLQTLQCNKAVIKVVRAPIELPHSLNELKDKPYLAKKNIPWSVISKGSDLPPIGLLVSMHLKDKSGGKPCGVALRCDKIDNIDDLEYHPDHDVHAVTFFGANESAASSPNDIRYLRDANKPVSKLFQYAHIPTDEMFSKKDLVFVPMEGAPHYNVRIASKIGHSLRKVATAEKEKAGNSGSDTSGNIFVTHPDTWDPKPIKGENWWVVNKPIIDNMRTLWDGIKKDEGPLDLSKGVNIEAFRVDGNAWNDKKNVCADVGDALQTDILNYASPCKANLEMVFVLPTGEQGN